VHARRAASAGAAVCRSCEGGHAADAWAVCGRWAGPAERRRTSSILVTEGMVTDVKPEQPSKAWKPMLVTEGMETDVKPEQPSKAALPMLVTEGGPADAGDGGHGDRRQA